MKISKEDLVRQIEEKTDLSYKEVKGSVNCVLDAIADRLKEGGRIEIRNFGAFSKRIHIKTKNRNPKTGEDLSPTKATRIIFKAGRLLKERVNNGKRESRLG